MSTEGSFFYFFQWLHIPLLYDIISVSMNQPKPTQFKKSYKRFRYVINKRFQLRFIAFMDFVALLVIGIFYSANLFFFADLRQKALAKGISEQHIFFKYLTLQEENLSRIFASTSFLVVGSLTVLGIFYSHRIAGPLYRLTKHFESIASGSPPRHVAFRQGDFFQEIPTAYNKHLDVLLKKVESEGKNTASKDQDQEFKTVA